MFRRGETRRWDNKTGIFGDEQRRRIPRLLSSGSVSAPSHPPHIDVDHCKNNFDAVAGSNARGDYITFTNDRETTPTSKELLIFGFGLVSPKHHHHLLPLCDSGNNQDDDDDEKHPCATPYSTKHQIKHDMPFPCPLHSCEQHDGAPNHLNNDESWLPQKNILELALNTLQRRDTYDIFGEPVDPNEVHEYYEIIKEPMDFGTMRAKLHEGMYKNLQQFKRDTYLIFENAMHFNSSSTVYFRQARALEELAKKVFHVLETDLENFEVNLTAKRGRSSRRFDGELNDLTFGSCRKLARDAESNKMHNDLGPTGCRRQRRSCLNGVDKRSTYKPWMCFLDEASSTISPIDYDTKSLIHARSYVAANEEEIGYKESLMIFVKDLGATAHRVAKLKLQGLCMQRLQ